MSVPYSAILTANDVDQESESAFEFDISDAGTLAVVESIIKEVTGVMEGTSGLGRNLITRQYSHYFQYDDWRYDEARSLYYVWAPQWPVVEIDTTGFTTGPSRESWQSESNLIFYASRYSGVVTYYAGYKRSEQVLSDFTSGAGLTNLATTPGNLPDDIRAVGIDLVLSYLAVRRFGPGQRTRVLNPAVQSTTIQEPVLDYASRTVRERLGHHRRLV